MSIKVSNVASKKKRFYILGLLLFLLMFQLISCDKLSKLQYHTVKSRFEERWFLNNYPYSMKTLSAHWKNHPRPNEDCLIYCRKDGKETYIGVFLYPRSSDKIKSFLQSNKKNKYEYFAAVDTGKHVLGFTFRQHIQSQDQNYSSPEKEDFLNLVNSFREEIYIDLNQYRTIRKKYKSTQIIKDIPEMINDMEFIGNRLQSLENIGQHIYASKKELREKGSVIIIPTSSNRSFTLPKFTKKEIQNILLELIKFLHHHDRVVRKTTVNILVAMRDLSLPALNHFYDSESLTHEIKADIAKEDFFSYNAVIYTMIKIGGKAKPLAIKLLKSDNPNARLSSLLYFHNVVSSLEMPMELIEPLIKDDELIIVENALNLIIKNKNKYYARMLFSLLLNSTGERSKLIENALYTLCGTERLAVPLHNLTIDYKKEKAIEEIELIINEIFKD